MKRVTNRPSLLLCRSSECYEQPGCSKAKRADRAPRPRSLTTNAGEQPLSVYTFKVKQDSIWTSVPAHEPHRLHLSSRTQHHLHQHVRTTVFWMPLLLMLECVRRCHTRIRVHFLQVGAYPMRDSMPPSLDAL